MVIVVEQWQEEKRSYRSEGGFGLVGEAAHFQDLMNDREYARLCHLDIAAGKNDDGNAESVRYIMEHAVIAIRNGSGSIEVCGFVHVFDHYGQPCEYLPKYRKYLFDGYKKQRWTMVPAAIDFNSKKFCCVFR